ncbi:hypothetical protein HYQ45_017996 [Verticillium longisporum]|uniref:Uncharacterized protein n=1 Tax=Verticillium longisporum TaxID=100787 RepID=A0A0G4M158_VERLO|nr:hypothetical protein HYQ45_017996 [Verticillium longisporum]KAG7121613.1 hypothetical protein HYQ44_003800 [Verticillium longisporum]KAG7147208.1 hypothetical protein HYQ46_003963 [Verticillium longisporum]CRK27560.1 hypothetical protein BN1708_014827 [Verticillium longisporum]
MAEVLGAVSASGHLVEAALHLGDYIKRLCEQYKGLEDYTQNIETDTMSIQTGAVAVKQSLDETPLSWQNPEDRKLDDDLDRLLTENIKNIKELHQHLKGINECNRSKLRKFGKRLQSDTKIKSLREKLRETQHRIDSHINRRMGRDLGRLRQDFYEHDNSSTESVNQLSQEVQTLAQGHDDMLSRILASQEQILEGQERLYKENAEMKKQMQGVSEQQNGIMSGLQAFATRWWSGANNDQAPALQPAAAKQIEAPPKPRNAGCGPPCRRLYAPGR